MKIASNTTLSELNMNMFCGDVVNKYHMLTLPEASAMEIEVERRISEAVSDIRAEIYRQGVSDGINGVCDQLTLVRSVSISREYN